MHYQLFYSDTYLICIPLGRAGAPQHRRRVGNFFFQDEQTKFVFPQKKLTSSHSFCKCLKYFWIFFTWWLAQRHGRINHAQKRWVLLGSAVSFVCDIISISLVVGVSTTRPCQTLTDTFETPVFISRRWSIQASWGFVLRLQLMPENMHFLLFTCVLWLRHQVNF